LQLLQKNLFERLPSALVLWLNGMAGIARASCVRRLSLRALLCFLFGTATVCSVTWFSERYEADSPRHGRTVRQQSAVEKLRAGGQREPTHGLQPLARRLYPQGCFIVN